MDVLSPGFKGLLYNARCIRKGRVSDYGLGRWSAMFELWADKARGSLLDILANDQLGPHQAALAGKAAETAYHYGRLRLLCEREWGRRLRAKYE